MNDALLWNTIHEKYATTDWIDKPSLFAQWAMQYLPQKGTMLDIGAGQGQDSRYFAANGLVVTSTDYSDTALGLNQKKIAGGMTVQKLDLTLPFDLTPSTFDVVYSHLAIHYFSNTLTQQIFDEIYKVLKPNGILALLVNSINDPEFGTGKKLEDELWEIEPAFVKRFYSLPSMAIYTQNFDTIVLDEQGSTYKDEAKDVRNLIRYVGKKKSE